MQRRVRSTVVGALGALALGAVLGWSALALAASHAPARRALSVCPRRDRHPVTSTAAGADETLVPAGARTVLLCRYSGLLASPRTSLSLAAADLVAGRKSTGELANGLNALPPPPPGGVSCPADDGRAIIAVFRYGNTGRADDPVTVSLSGCTMVTNGQVARWAAMSPGVALLHRLEHLTRVPRYACAPPRRAFRNSG